MGYSHICVYVAHTYVHMLTFERYIQVHVCENSTYFTYIFHIGYQGTIIVCTYTSNVCSMYVYIHVNSLFQSLSKTLPFATVEVYSPSITRF